MSYLCRPAALLGSGMFPLSLVYGFNPRGAAHVAVRLFFCIKNIFKFVLVDLPQHLQHLHLCLGEQVLLFIAPQGNRAF